MLVRALLFVWLVGCLCVCAFDCLFVCLFVCVFVCVFICLFVCLCVCSYVCLCVCLFVSVKVCSTRSAPLHWIGVTETGFAGPTKLIEAPTSAYEAYIFGLISLLNLGCLAELA